MSLVNPVAAAARTSPVAAAAAAQLMPVMIGPMTTATGPVVGGGGGGGKDSRWLTLEVCREFARSKCSRSDEECKYAHPPPHVEIQNGRVMCCFDSIKGKCQRKDPPCKYLHPPQHLKEILLQNGRQNLINKNLQLQATLQPILSVPPGMVPFMYEPSPSGGAIKPTATIIPTAGGYSNGVVMSAPTAASAGQYLTVLPQPTAGGGHQYILPSVAAATGAGYPCYGPTLAGFSPTAFYPTIDGSPAAVSLHPGSLLTQTVTPNRTWNVATLPAAATGCYGLSSGAVGPAATIHAISYDVGSGGHLQQNLSGNSASSTSVASTVQGHGQLTLDAAATGTVVTTADGVSSPVPTTATQIDPSSVSSSMPYCQQPVYYKHQMVEVLTGAGMSRKRMLEQSVASSGATGGEDLFLGMTANYNGMMPVLKRPALIDAKTGLPVYQQITATPSYQQMAALGAMQSLQSQQYVSVPIANPSQLQRF